MQCAEKARYGLIVEIHGYWRLQRKRLEESCRTQHNMTKLSSFHGDFGKENQTRNCKIFRDHLQ